MNAHTPFSKFAPLQSAPPIIINLTIEGGLYLGDDHRRVVEGDVYNSTTYIEPEPKADFYVASNGDVVSELVVTTETVEIDGTGIDAGEIEGFADAVRAVLRAEAQKQSEPALGIGRIVHYHPTWEELPPLSSKLLPTTMAALVTGVFLAGDNETPMASLAVFPPGRAPFYPNACLEGDVTKPGTWSWPPRS